MEKNNKNFEHEEILDEEAQNTVEIEEISPEDNTDEIEYIEVEADFYEIEENEDEDEEVQYEPDNKEEPIIQNQTKVKKKRPKTKTKVKVKEKKIKDKDKNKNENRSIIILAAVLLVALIGYFTWTHFIQMDEVNPFELVSVKVVGTDGNGSLEIEKNEKLNQEQEDIYKRITYEVKDNGTFHKKDKAQVEVIIEDESWFKENKIKLVPIKETYTIDFLVDKLLFNWEEYLEYELTFERGIVRVNDLRFNDSVPQELQEIMEASKLKTDKSDYYFGDLVKVTLDLKPKDMKTIHEKGYEVQGVVHEFNIDEFSYVPKYFEDIPKLELLQEKSLIALKNKYEKAQDINLERICYRLDEQATLYYLYSFTLDEKEQAVAIGLDHVKGTGSELDESTLIETVEENKSLVELEKMMKNESFTCIKP